MLDEIKEIRKESNLLKILVILLIIAVGSYVGGIIWGALSHFADILIILGLSWLLSFIIEPIVEYIEGKTKVTKVWATLFTYVLIAVLMTVIVLLFIPMVISQIASLAERIPAYYDAAPKFVTRTADSVSEYVNNGINYAPSIVQFFLSLIVILIISFYLTVDKDRINKEMYDLVPEEWHARMRFMQKVINTTFASFLRVQLVFGLLSGIVTFLVLQILGIEFAASTALLAGIFAVIPLVGPLLAIIPPVLVGFLADPAKAIIIFIILFIAQQLIFNVIGPKLLGNAFKIHPAVILISFLIGAKIAGGIGAIFAIPVLGIAVVIIREFWHTIVRSEEKAR